MKTIEFTATNGDLVSLMPNKIIAIALDKGYGMVKIFAVGHDRPFWVEGSYEEAVEKIKEM